MRREEKGFVIVQSNRTRNISDGFLIKNIKLLRKV
jgi:hypothetical protein